VSARAGFFRRRLYRLVLNSIWHDIGRGIRQEKFDRTLSENLDCVLNLQERYGARLSSPSGEDLPLSGTPSLSGREADGFDKQYG
jgi:hypothetical protein